MNTIIIILAWASTLFFAYARGRQDEHLEMTGEELKFEFQREKFVEAVKKALEAAKSKLA